MAKVAHFEIETRNPEKMMEFYTQALGWKFQKMEGFDGYWLITAGDNEEEGINGALMLSEHESVRTINTMSVGNIDETLGAVEKAGGKVLTPKMEVPNVGVFAYCTDPQGTQFGVMQFHG